MQLTKLVRVFRRGSLPGSALFFSVLFSPLGCAARQGLAYLGNRAFHDPDRSAARCGLTRGQSGFGEVYGFLHNSAGALP